MPSPSQDTVACTCPSCGNLFAVETSFLGRQVTCPICSAPVTGRNPGTGGKALPGNGRTGARHPGTEAGT